MSQWTTDPEPFPYQTPQEIRTTCVCAQLITPTSVLDSQRTGIHSVSESPVDQNRVSWQQLLTACSAAVSAVAEKQVTACPLSAVFGNTLLTLRSCGMTKVWATGKTSWLTNLPLSVRVQGTLGSVQHACCYVPVMLQVTVHVAKVGNIQVHSLSTRVLEVLRQCFEWWFNGFSHVKFSAFFQVQLSQKCFFFWLIPTLKSSMITYCAGSE